MPDETVSAYGYVAEQLNARYEQGRADEREKCRAELWAGILHLEKRSRDELLEWPELWSALAVWAREEAFGGE